MSLHEQALQQFDEIQSALRDERMQCLQDRRFYSLAGAQWEGPLGDQFENKPRFEVNKVHLSVIRIINEYRNNRLTVRFVSKDGQMGDKLADTCADLYRADEQDSTADEAYDNAFEEAVGGGFGAWRLRAEYEDDEDDENEKQRVCIEPIFDADSSVFFDLQAKRQDKADAKYCFVLTSMTREAYKDMWGDDPTTWPKTIHQYEFDWATPDVVFVAEYYRIEERTEKIFIYEGLDGSTQRLSEEELDDDERKALKSMGFKKVKERKVKRRKVHKWIMSGGKVLEDCGYIAGKCIPIVPVYGKRWFVDNIERCMGHVRLAKDAQRLKNMQLSKLGEISALSSVEKPIMLPEQVAGHQLMWAEDNLKNYPYLLVNPITGPDGSTQAAGPVSYTKSPSVPPALAGLLQLTEADMQEILGSQGEGDKIVSNISGAAVEMVQNRLDMQTFIYLSNFAKGMQRCGEVWLSMAKEIYAEDGRMMKAVQSDGSARTVELMRPTIDPQTGAMVYENDLSQASLDVAVEVGPSSSSKRAATVRALVSMLQLTDDPQTKQVLQSVALMNMEGEGVEDIRDYFRKNLLRMGVLKPSEDEAKELMAEIQNKPQDPNALYLQAAAMEAQAKAEKAKADTIKVLADAELAKAKTAATYDSINEPGAAQAQPMQANPAVTEAEDLKLQGMRIDIAMRLKELMRKEREEESEQEETQIENEARDAIVQSSESIKEAVSDLRQTVQTFSSSMTDFAQTSKKASEEAIKALNRPKRIIREKGKIVGVE